MIVYAIYNNITLICIRSHICSFILRFSYFSIIHIFLYFYHACIYSFLYSYHIIVYSYMPIIRVHVLILGNILYLVNLYLHALYFRLSYLMTYTYTFLYLYVLLVLYHTFLSPIGVRNIDYFFNTLRYPSCPNYLPFYLFLFRYTRINIRLLGPEIKNERDSVQYIPEGTVRYGKETCLPT